MITFLRIFPATVLFTFSDVDQDPDPHGRIMRDLLDLDGGYGSGSTVDLGGAKAAKNGP